MKEKAIVVGAGLAGSEAAWQLAEQGVKVELIEKRPKTLTPAHKTGSFAELVCSNTFKSLDPDSASGRLKLEMTEMNSVIIDQGHKNAVPAGSALGIDRERFSKAVTEKLKAHPLIEIKEEEFTKIPSQEELKADSAHLLIASGPLTDGPLMESLGSLCENKNDLYFYDAIAPIVSFDSIDLEHTFFADRYADEEANKDAAYLNIPLDKDQYTQFIEALRTAERVPLHSFEKEKYFESCLPIEVMADRGVDTLRFGPLKPVGLTNPRTGRYAYACIQLRPENKEKTMYSMVGFQSKMKWPEQKRVFTSLLPALKEAEFLRYGSIHRNSYIQSPKLLNPDFSFKSNDRVFIAGQISGVEGYTESAAIGLLAGRSIVARKKGQAFELPPKESITGALAHYVLFGGTGVFAPMNANHGLLAPIKDRKLSKKDRRRAQVKRAETEFARYMAEKVS